MASAIHFGDANSGFQAGNIYGPVNTEFHHHAPPERPETPPNPSALIPFSRDTDFVERGTILDQIHQKCDAPGSRTALVGLGGVGKSQLAIEYAYRTRERSPELWVFWVHASNAARFEQSFRDIANCVKIPGRQDPRANVFQLVHDWLCDDKKGTWVLILDNIDDASFLLEAHSTSPDVQPNGSNGGNARPLVSYLPQCQNGSILITTRSRSAAMKLVEQRDIITVEPMEEAHAMALFTRKLENLEKPGIKFHEEDIAELAAALEFMPLAIVQAAAYISERAPRCSVRQYLEQFQKSDRKRMSLLDYERGQLRRDQEAKNSIIITWQISFDHMCQTRPSAADLLSLMSFFDCQGIPEVLLKSRNEQGDAQRDQKERGDDRWDDDEDHLSQSSQSNEFEEDVVVLRNFSFISINTDGTTFKMHRLVQLATWKWLEAHGQLEKWKQQFVRKLCEEFPTGEHENWAVCQVLFPHANAATAQRPEGQDSLRDWASILYKAAWYAWKIGNGVGAENMSVQAMRARKTVLGQEHEDTLWSMAMVGHVYKLRGRWGGAEELEVQVMEARKKKLGADHPDTLTSIANLAETYLMQGRWDAAEELGVQVIETRKKLGADHPDTLASMNNLASTYVYQGRWAKAEELLVQVIETSKKKLGAGHPSTLTSMNNLASTYLYQCRWAKAEELLVQVMETSKKKLGADHPDTLRSMSNLASTYLMQGRWEAAEELGVQVMETRKKKLGPDHPETLDSMANLASTYKDQGRWEAAEELFLQVIEMSKKKLGADHPDTLASINHLASTYMYQGRLAKAEELFVQVMETRKKKLGADHPDTLTSMNNLAFTWKKQGRDAEAIGLMMECVQLGERVLGASHPHFTSSTNWLARWEAERSGPGALAGGVPEVD